MSFFNKKGDEYFYKSGSRPINPPTNSVLEETDTEDRYRYNQYNRWEKIPHISLKSKRIQTLFCPFTDQTGLIFGNATWQGINAELHSSGCMIFQTRTSITTTETPGFAVLNDFANVDMLPKGQISFSFNDTSNKCSAAIGFWNDAHTHPISSSLMANSGEAFLVFGFRKTDTNYFIFNNDSSGAFSAIDTGIARDTNVYTLEMEYQTSTDCRVSLFDINSVLVYEDVYSSEIPGTGIDLAFGAQIFNVDTVKRYVINIFDYMRLEKTRPPLNATTDF